MVVVVNDGDRRSCLLLELDWWRFDVDTGGGLVGMESGGIQRNARFDGRQKKSFNILNNMYCVVFVKNIIFKNAFMTCMFLCVSKHYSKIKRCKFQYHIVSSLQ